MAQYTTFREKDSRSAAPKGRLRRCREAGERWAISDAPVTGRKGFQRRCRRVLYELWKMVGYDPDKPNYRACWVSIDNLAKLSGLGRKATQRCMQRLRADGILTSERRKGYPGMTWRHEIVCPTAAGLPNMTVVPIGDPGPAKAAEVPDPHRTEKAESVLTRQDRKGRKCPEPTEQANTNMQTTARAGRGAGGLDVNSALKALAQTPSQVEPVNPGLVALGRANASKMERAGVRDRAAIAWATDPRNAYDAQLVLLDNEEPGTIVNKLRAAMGRSGRN